MDLADAVEAAIHRHYPVYPVVDADRHVIGVVRGWRLFERQAIEISAQSGQMVGVDKENCRGSYIVRLGGGKVRYGSLADNRARIGDVCFTP